MAETTAIEWTNHTFNPWIGCMKVSPLCDHCYAADLVATKKWFTPVPTSAARAAAASYQWGAPGVGVGHRQLTSAATWKNPLRWQRQAVQNGTRPFVFCASLADVFDNAIPVEWRLDLFDLIRATPNLVWLLLTKRPQNIARMIEAVGGLPTNVALGASAGIQSEVITAVALLARAKLTLNPAFTFMSAEPLLGPITLTAPSLSTIMASASSRPDWVIVGGESGKGARLMDLAWARSIRDEMPAGVIFNFKQTGGYPGSGKGSHKLDGQVHFGRPQPANPVSPAVPLPSPRRQQSQFASRAVTPSIAPAPAKITVIGVKRFTRSEAMLEKSRVTADRVAGRISVDEERERRMAITLATDGLSPP